MSDTLVLSTARSKPLPKLPEEVLAMIFAHASECDPNGCEPACIHSRTLLSCANVCKTWLRQSQPLLYNSVSLNSFRNALRFALALSSLRTQLGDHVRQLRTGPALANQMSLARILDFTPNLRALATSFKQCRDLQKRPVWKQLKHLQLIQESGTSGRALLKQRLSFIREKCFPPSLQTLTLEGGMEWLCDGKDWSKYTPPSLETLIIKGNSRPRIDTSSVLPHLRCSKLPKIRCLKFLVTDFAYLPRQSLFKMINETSKTLTSLEIRMDPTPLNVESQLLVPGLLGDLANLRHLTWIGPTPFCNQDYVRITFPASLRKVNLTVVNTWEYVRCFLKLLLDLSFLPHLAECPIVTLLLDPLTSQQVKPLGIRKFLRRGIQVTQHWKEHRRTPLSINPPSPAEGYLCIPCLPFPGHYKSLLAPAILREMTELEAKGQVRSEE